MPLLTRYWFLDTGYWIFKGSFPYFIQHPASSIKYLVHESGESNEKVYNNINGFADFAFT